MNRFRAEVIGNVPNGLTHNDVFASFLSMMREHDSECVVTKRRLAGNMISLVVTFKAKDVIAARVMLHAAKTGIYNFVGDTVVLRDMGK